MTPRQKFGIPTYFKNKLISYFRKRAPLTFATKKGIFVVFLDGPMKLIYAKLQFAKLMVLLAKMEIALHQADVNVKLDGKFITQKDKKVFQMIFSSIGLVIYANFA